ncbi:hypothetical protein PInf_024413 [Phytophthora infestans]|nr:hypothetical protein PInf_024413 [Phytophthora infestans]
MFPQVAVSTLFLQLLGNSNFPASVRNIRLKALTMVQLRPLDMSFPSQSDETPPPSELTCIMVLTEKRFLESEMEFTVQTDLFDDQGTSSFSMDDSVVTRASANLFEESFECSARNVSEFKDVSVVDVTGARTNKTDAAPLTWMLARATGMLQQQNRVPAQPLMCSCRFGEELTSVPLRKKLALQSWTDEESFLQQTQPEVAKFAVNSQDANVMTGILRTVGWNFSNASHENDNGVTEPLLPAHSKGRSNSLSSTPNTVYDRDSMEHVERGEVHAKNRPLRDSYLKQLGYTPLIFKKMKKIGSFIASMSPMRTRKPNDDDLLSDAFPYHQSITPSKGSIRGSVFNLAGATLGAGALSLPYAVAVSGLGFAVAQLVLAAVLTVYTIRLLIRAEDITKLKSYEDLAMYCFGTKMTVFVEVNILVFCFGISVAYLLGYRFESWPNFMLSVPIVMFAFTCQVNVFSIYTELQRPCIRRMNKVVDRATLISFLIYLSIGVVAYLAFGPQLTEPKYKGNILLSFPLNDTLIAISRAAITFTVAVAFPLNIFPCRFTIDMIINVVFGIIGGTCSTVVCFCFPAAFILKLEDGPLLGPKKIGPLLLLIGAIVIGFVARVLRLVQPAHATSVSRCLQ